MKNFYILIMVLLFNNISLASDDHNHGHKHKMIEASTPFPTLNVTLEKDAMSGYNLFILTTNFEFAPENVNQKNNGNEGHAHIYINGQKFRQYSPYFHISGKLLKEGDNEIKVTLNSNDHSHFTVNKKPLTEVSKIHHHKNH